MHYVAVIFLFLLYSLCNILSNQITCLVKDPLLLHIKRAKPGLTWSQQKRGVNIVAKGHVVAVLC